MGGATDGPEEAHPESLVGAMLIAPRTDRFRLGRGPFVSGRSQLNGAGSLAFLAPMPLRTVQPLPHPAVIANENFFSHANLVSTLRRRLCQALFLGPPSRGPRPAKPNTPEKSRVAYEKSLPAKSRILQCTSKPLGT